MIDKTSLRDFIESRLEGTDLYLVDLTVSATNEIVVEIDSDSSVDIDRCVKLSREIEQNFDRDDEDYELEVGSAGLTSPFKVPGQYYKNVGNPVEVLTLDGRKIKGTLSEVADNAGSFTVTTKVKVKEPGKKKPVEAEQAVTLTPEECKYVKYLIEFK